MFVEIAIPTYKRAEKLKRLIGSILTNEYPHYIITILPDYSRSKVFRLLNEQSKVSNADIFLGISDDTEFKPDVIQTAVNYMIKYFPDTNGIISMDWLNLPNVCDGAIAFVGKNFRRRFPNKFLYCPDYTSLYADEELSRYAKQENCLVKCLSTGLCHYHPSHYPEQMDETHIIGRETSNQDKNIQKLRRERNLLWGASNELISGHI